MDQNGAYWAQKRWAARTRVCSFWNRLCWIRAGSCIRSLRNALWDKVHWPQKVLGSFRVLADTLSVAPYSSCKRLTNTASTIENLLQFCQESDYDSLESLNAEKLQPSKSVLIARAALHSEFYKITIVVSESYWSRTGVKKSTDVFMLAAWPDCW